MYGTAELAHIQAEVFRPGDERGYDFLLKREGHLWWYADPAVMTVWDALANDVERGDTGVFVVQAVCFTFTSILNPNAGYLGGLSSYLEVAISGGQEIVSDVFEGDEENSLARMADVAQRRWYQEGTGLPVRFIGVFDVIFDQYRDEDGHIDDWTCSASFLGELDLFGTLPLTTAPMEMQLLRLLPSGEALALDVIANRLNCPDEGWLVADAVKTLSREGLIQAEAGVHPLRYSLTAQGQEVVGA